MDKQRVFVYGTLKRGNTTRGLDTMSGSNIFISEARTSDQTYSLYDLGTYPAVGTVGEYYIEGEVWEVDSATMETLDRIEGYPNFYNRKKINTTMGEAWIYFIENIDRFYDTKNKRIESENSNTLSWNW